MDRSVRRRSAERDAVVAGTDRQTLIEIREGFGAKRRRNASFEFDRARQKRQRGQRARGASSAFDSARSYSCTCASSIAAAPAVRAHVRRSACKQALRGVEQALAVDDVEGSQSYAPMMQTAATFDIGEPPRLCVMPIEGFGSCRSPARPCNCRYIS